MSDPLVAAGALGSSGVVSSVEPTKSAKRIVTVCVFAKTSPRRSGGRIIGGQ
jgi:hypothetical protein